MELDVRVTVTSQNGSAGVAMGLRELIQDDLPPDITVTVERFGKHQLSIYHVSLTAYSHELIPLTIGPFPLPVRRHSIAYQLDAEPKGFAWFRNERALESRVLSTERVVLMAR